MQAYELAQLISQRASSNKLYLEFLKVPNLSMGLYVLPAGGRDPQCRIRRTKSIMWSAGGLKSL